MAFKDPALNYVVTPLMITFLSTLVSFLSVLLYVSFHIIKFSTRKEKPLKLR